MDNSKNSRVFNFEILLKSWKSDSREIYMFYSMFKSQNLGNVVSNNDKNVMEAVNENFVWKVYTAMFYKKTTTV